MNEQDLIKYKQLKHVLKSGEFNLKGDAVTSVAALFQWYNELENKIEAQISKPVLKEPIKKVE